MLKRLFSRRDAADVADVAEEGAEEGATEAPVPRQAGGLSLGLLWFLAFLLSALVIGAVGLVSYRQLEAQTGVLSDAAVKARGERLGAEIGGRILGLSDVVDRAAAQPALAAVMASGDPAAIAVRADALAATIPDALRVRLLTPGASEPDETLSPRLGYAGLDLARQAESGKRPALELHWAGSPDQHIALARPIGAPQQPVAGVLLASIDSTALGRWIAAALPEGAYAEVRQSADGQAVIASGGDAARKGVAPTGSAQLAGSTWELVYWLPQTASLSFEGQVAFFAPFGVAVVVLGLLFAVLGVVDGRLVRADVIALVTHVFDLLQRKRAHGHTVRLRDFRKAVEVLDENIQLPSQPEPTPRASPRTAVPENPLFLPQDTITVEEVDASGDKT